MRAEVNRRLGSRTSRGRTGTPCSGASRVGRHIWRERNPKSTESAIRPRFVRDSFQGLTAARIPSHRETDRESEAGCKRLYSETSPANQHALGTKLERKSASPTKAPPPGREPPRRRTAGRPPP